MKKTILSLSFILTLGFSFSQIYSASEQADFAAWTFVDGDADGFNWSIATFEAPMGAAIESFSWDENTDAALTPNNFAVSPSINCTGQATVWLNWLDHSYANAAYSQETYAVYVVTSIAPILAGIFPDPVFQTTLSGEGPMNQRFVDISAIAANQASVYVVFRHFDCTDMLSLVIDDVSLTTAFVNVEENLAQEVSLYPNPATTVLNINNNDEIASVVVMSLDGKIVLSEMVNGSTSTLDVSGLQNGAYICEVRAVNGTITRQQFIKN